MTSLVRQFHRWVSLAFLAAVIAAAMALAQKEPVTWMSYLPLPPLGVLAITGVYLFIRPHLARGRRAGPREAA